MIINGMRKMMDEKRTRPITMLSVTLDAEAKDPAPVGSHHWLIISKAKRKIRKE